MTLLLYDDFVARMTLLLYHDLIAVLLLSPMPNLFAQDGEIERTNLVGDVLRL